MNNVMDINSLLRRLITLTEDNKCQWDELSNHVYRLIVKDGTIQIQKQLDTFGQFMYSVKLFDNAECFATFLSNEDYNLKELLEELFLAIKRYRDRAINIKIAHVFGHL